MKRPLVLAFALALGTAGFACSEKGDNNGTGGSSGSGGSGGSAGSRGGSGGSTGGTGGSTGGTSGSTGGTGGTGGSSSDGGKMDGMGGMDAGGAFALRVTGAEVRNGKLYFKRGQTRDTGQQSPEMEWDAFPGAMSYAISMVDTENNNTHWVMYDIPTTVTKLPANLMRGMQNAPEVMGAKHTAFGGTRGYFGPGAGCRTYNFQVHALKVANLDIGGASNNNLRTMVLANAMNRIQAAPAVGLIGQASAGMCP
jgi:phosphatidylethanolamine-binding protein (PEBP) family uncharacterized protein